MMTSDGLRIERPYASVEDYLAGDAWTVERSEMVLVGCSVTDDLPIGAAVHFAIVLLNGESVVSGEGRVLEPVPEREDRPGGLKIRFRKLDPASKTVLRRALEAQRRGPRAPTTSVVTPEPAAAVPVASAPEVAAPTAAALPEPVAVAAPAVATSGPAEAKTAPEPSRVRHRPIGPVITPVNRDALLERLRERARKTAAALLETKTSTAAE